MAKVTQLIIGIFLFSVFNIEIPKRAFKLYEKGDIEKTIEALDKSLEKDTLNPAGNYLYSIIFIDTAFVGYHVDSAYNKINKAISNFGLITDTKDLGDLKDIGVTKESLELQKDKVDALQFSLIRKKHTIEAYNWFLNHHTDAAQIPEAIKLRNHIAFEKAAGTNTWESYFQFMQTYPKAEDLEEATNRYEKLLFEEKTADGKLSSLTDFLEEHPETFYRNEVEESIFNIATASNQIEDYTDFLKKYPNQKLAQKAIDRIYHLYKTEYPPEQFFASFKVEINKDSLEKVISAEKGIWIPKLEEGKINYVNRQGELALKSDFSSLTPECRCTASTSDFVWGEKNGSTQILGRNGQLIYEGEFRTVRDLGLGFLMLEKENGLQLIHKSGEVILNDLQESIHLLTQGLIRTQKNGFYGISSLNHQVILENEFTEIDTLGNYIWLEKEEGISLISPATLYEIAEGKSVNFSFEYQDVLPLENGDFLVIKNDQESVLDANLQTKIPFGNYEIRWKPYGWQLKSNRGIQVIHDRYPALRDSIYSQVLESSHWLALKKGSKWQLYDQTAELSPSFGYDSLGLWGENMALLKSGAKTLAKFPNGKTTAVEKGWEPKLLVPQNYISTGAKAEYDFFMLSNFKKFRKIYNNTGHEILSATFDDVVPLTPNLIRLQKKNAALTDSTGNFVLNFIYDGIGSNNNGYVSILDKGKVGVINVAKGIKIKPTYDKLLEPYSDTLMVATKGNLKGFVHVNGKELSAFDYDEIKFFTPNLALARIENEWFLHRISDEALLIEGMLDFEFMKNTPQEKVLMITKASGKGIFSSSKQEIIDPTYDDIKVLGTPEEPIYFAVKIVREANIYVVIYYDENGNKLFTQSFKQDEYFKIACPQN